MKGIDIPRPLVWKILRKSPMIGDLKLKAWTTTLSMELASVLKCSPGSRFTRSNIPGLVYVKTPSQTEKQHVQCER